MSKTSKKKTYRCLLCDSPFKKWTDCAQHLKHKHALGSALAKDGSTIREKCSRNAKPDEWMECIVCLDEKISCILLPCRHVICCTKCGKDAIGAKCPLRCNKLVEQAVESDSFTIDPPPFRRFSDFRRGGDS